MSISLISTTDKIQLVTSTAAALDVHFSYVDTRDRTVATNRKNTQIAGIATTDVVLPPGAATQRAIKFAAIWNDDASLACQVRILHTDGTTTVDLFTVTLSAKQGLQYTESLGWTVNSFTQLRFQDGTDLLPGMAFANDIDTGFYRPVSNGIGHVAAGVEWVRMVSNGSLRFGLFTSDNVATTASTSGVSIAQVGAIQISRDANTSLTQNRYNSDGTITSYRRSETQVGSVSVTTTATTYNTSSDYRLKTEIQEPAHYDVRDRIAALDACLTWYEWKANEAEGPQFGAMAHVLAEAAPYAVTGAKDAMDPETGDIAPQGVDWSKLVPELLAGLADAHRRIAILEASATAL